MAATKVNVAEPDFLAIRDALKEHLSSQSEFSDYDFEGSSLAVLLDILAYSNSYDAFLANMVGNEMFIDSAVQRASVVSRGKMLGYQPRSKRSAVAYLNIEVLPNDSPSTVTIPRGTKFASVLDGTTYTFSTLNSYVIFPDEDGLFKLTNVPITEGEVLKHKFTWSDSNPDQRYVLPNVGVDTTTIRVNVQESSVNLTTFVYQLQTDLNVIDANSLVYFLQEVEGGYQEIYFGDGVVGFKPKNGNIIFVDYLVSHGEDANNLTVFRAANGVGGYSTYTITTATKSSGGAEEEDIESIRKLAPLWYQAQGRAVTKNDYETLIKKDYPNIDSIRVWGGEENDPPYYGKVFVAIKPLDGTVLSDQTKENLVNNVIRKRNMVSIDVDIVDPDYIYLVIFVSLKWRADLTGDSEAQVQNTVIDSIVDYGREELDKFDTYFRFPRFVQRIDASHPAVKNNLTTVKLRYRMLTSLVNGQDYLINFSNAIDANETALAEPTLISSGFTLDGYSCFFDDDGDGKVRVYRLLEGQKVIVRSNIGSIDYNTGKIQINDFLPTAIAGNLPYISLTVRPLVSDIETERDQLILIDEDAIFVDMLDESGLIRA